MARTLHLTHGWLHFPIGRDAEPRYVKFEAGGRQIAELYMGVVPGEPDFWCGMDLTR